MRVQFCAWAVWFVLIQAKECQGIVSIQEVVKSTEPCISARHCSKTLPSSSALGLQRATLSLGTEAGSLEQESGGETEARLHLLHY